MLVDRRPDDAHAKVGELVAGRYELERSLHARRDASAPIRTSASLLLKGVAGAVPLRAAR